MSCENKKRHRKHEDHEISDHEMTRPFFPSWPIIPQLRYPQGLCGEIHHFHYIIQPLIPQLWPLSQQFYPYYRRCPGYRRYPEPCHWYIVRPGDTMYQIARRYNIPLNELIAANPQIPDPDLIYPGQQICVPRT